MSRRPSLPHVQSEGEVSVVAAETVEVEGLRLRGRFAEGVDVLTAGVQLRTSGGQAGGAAELVAAGGLSAQLGGGLDAYAGGGVRAAAVGSVDAALLGDLQARAGGDAALTLGGDAAFASGGSANATFAQSVWLSSSYVGLESSAGVDLAAGRQLSATALERVTVASTGSAIELLGEGVR
jgi:hypothetical protein|eukprot:COSAG01_NODE_321_length_18903_cov_13.082429_20_plen_180_part_00